jgi:hypothetical protein
MKFTFNNKELDQVLMGANGEEANPYKAIEFVFLTEEGPPLDPVDLLVFIEENYPTLLALCAEAHECWKGEQAPGVLH